MNNSYIIMNRKTSIIIKIFLINTLILSSFVIWGLYTLTYQSFVQIHSKILYFDSFYYMEVLVPVKEVIQITKQNQILIDDKIYNYNIHYIDSNSIYLNNENYQKIYLKVLNLDKSYLINGYEMDIKILTEKKKIIDYIKE